MNKHSRVKWLFMCLLFLLAGRAQAAAGWTDFGSVAELTPTSRHYYEVSLAVSNNPSACSNKNGFYQDYTSRGAQQMFTSLLEAVKTGLRVRVYVTGVCNIDGYSEISSVSVAP